ncbi:MAG: hypothetical protein LBK65_04050 [Tannerellaceae bacterium]|nr:hypothetical protein [Tannerellaceae bacterium]
MIPAYKLFIISLLPCCCLAQTETQTAGGGWKEKALYRELLRLDDPLYTSHNPVYISDAPSTSLTIFDVTRSSQSGSYKPISSAGTEERGTGRIYGIRKTGPIAFEGSIEYANETLGDKKWGNYLFISDDNPFFISDSLVTNYGTELFRLEGALSYQVSPRWKAALKATYHVGTLAGQSDPRPWTKGMRFSLNPGTSYRLSEQFLIGASAAYGRLGESVNYTVVNTSEPNVNTIFLFKGLGNPELKNAIGYKRTYEGGEYRADVQMLWRPLPSLYNLFEAGYSQAWEYADDGDAGFNYKGGDYKAAGWQISDLLRLVTPAATHSVTIAAGSKSTDGIWYIQTQSTDKDGNIVWAVRDKSIAHKEQTLRTSFGYTADLRNRDGIPRLAVRLSAAYVNTTIKQYPDLYNARYSLATYSGGLTKHFFIRGNSLLSLSADFTLATSHRYFTEASGSRLESPYLDPAFRAAVSSYGEMAFGTTWQKPLSLRSNTFLLGFRAVSLLNIYKGPASDVSVFLTF